MAILSFLSDLLSKFQAAGGFGTIHLLGKIVVLAGDFKNIIFVIS